MAATSTIMVVTREPATEQAIGSALEKSGRLELAGVCPGLTELTLRLDRAPAGAVLVDIDPEPHGMLRTLDRIAARFGGTRFVVVASSIESELVLEAMQAGARHFLLKAAIPADLTEVLHRLIPNNVGELEEGVIISVLSVSGGCGATTLAVNLANEVRLATSQSVLLVDLDAAYGAVASYLDLKGQYGIADVLSSPSRIDQELVLSTAVAHSDNLRVLMSPASIDFSRPAALDYRHLDDVLRACKRACSFTLIDAPRVPMDIAAALAASSKATLLVFQLTVKDLRTARSMLNALVERGVPRDRILALANRFRRWHQMVTLDEAGKTLRDVKVEPISNDFRGSVLGINYGQPLSQAAPRSALRRDLEKLAGKLRTLGPTSTS